MRCAGLVHRDGGTLIKETVTVLVVLQEKYRQVLSMEINAEQKNDAFMGLVNTRLS